MLPTQPATTYRALAFNAIFLYLTAYLATIILHESGHALMSLALGGAAHPLQYLRAKRQ
jgi:hypothetical protein